MGKICLKCYVSKEDAEFARNYNIKDSIKYTNTCKACVYMKNVKWVEENREVYNARAQARRWARKERAVEYLGGKCVHCRSTFHAAAFDFHHVDKSTKHKDPGLMMTHSDETLFKELDKCILLCANCHRVEHFNNGY